MGEFETEIEIDQTKAGFKLDKIYDIADVITQKERISYLDSCSRFGNVFVGRQNGFDLYAQTELEKSEEPKSLVSVDLSGQLRWIAVSCDGLSLMIITYKDNATNITFYDTRTLLKGTKAPFSKQDPPPSPGNGHVVSACWNPSLPEFVTIIFANGAIQVMRVDSKAEVIETRPPFGVSCIAWSPKGKQMVLGKSDGTMSQFTHTPLIEKKKISACPSFTEKVKISDVQWLSTYLFAVNYESSNENSAPNIFTVHLPEKGQTREPIWRSFEDPTFAGDIIRRGQVYFPYITAWNSVAVLSSNSGDGALLGKIDANEYKIWLMADHLRFELPLDDGGATDSGSKNPCVIGATWNYNSTRTFMIGERQVNPSPTLFVLSNTGVLVKYELFNLMPGFSDLQHITDRVPNGERRPLPLEEVTHPRISISKPLERTNSLFPVPKPSTTLKTFGSSLLTSSPAPSLSNQPMAQSTPASAAQIPAASGAAQLPLVKPLIKLQSDTVSSDGSETVNLFEEKFQGQHRRQASHEIIQPRAKPDMTSGPTKEDLLELVMDFERELEEYKYENSKIDLRGLDDESKKQTVKQINALVSFEDQVHVTLKSNFDELNELKLRSLESWASAEEIKYRTSCNNFMARTKAAIGMPLCPVLTRQLRQINSYKAYLNSSLADLELLLTKKKRQATKQQTCMKSVYQLITNNEKVLRFQKSRLEILTSQLNQVRIDRSRVVYLSRKKEELPVTPGFMKSTIRPDQANKLKKMLSARKSIPIVPSPKRDIRDQVLKVINRRPEAVVQRQRAAQEEALGVAKLNLDGAYDLEVTDQSFKTEDTIKTRDSPSVVSYMPRIGTKLAPKSTSASKEKPDKDKDSLLNLNNPPQVINAAELKEELPPSLAPKFFTPTSKTVNKETANAVQTMLNTVHLTTATPVKDTTKPTGGLFGSKQAEATSKSGLFGSKVDNSSSIFRLKKDDSKQSFFGSLATQSTESIGSSQSKATLFDSPDDKADGLLPPKNEEEPAKDKKELPVKKLFSSTKETTASDENISKLKEDPPKGLFATKLETAKVEVSTNPTGLPKPGLFGSASAGNFGSTPSNPFAPKTHDGKNPFGLSSKVDMFGSFKTTNTEHEYVFSEERETEDEKERTESESAVDSEGTAADETEPEEEVTVTQSTTLVDVSTIKTEGSNVANVEVKAVEVVKEVKSPEVEKAAATGETIIEGRKVVEKEEPVTDIGLPKPNLFGRSEEKTTEKQTSEKSETAATGTELIKPGLFGSSVQSDDGLFGATTPGIFGTKPPPPDKPPSGLFASTTSDIAAPETKPTGVFPSKPTEMFGKVVPFDGLFTTSQKNESIFGQTGTPKSIFGSSTPSESGSIFSSQSNELKPAASLFGSSKPEGTSSNIFGSSSTTAQSSIFGSSQQTSVFGSSVNQPQKGLFGSSNQTAPASQSGGLFGSSSANSNSGGGLFGSSQSASLSPFSGQTSFGNNQQNQSSSGLFGSSGGFGGLGGTPDPEKAKINPFASNQSNTSNDFNPKNDAIFGSTKPSGFGSSFGQTPNQIAGPFSGGGNTNAFGSPTNANAGFGSNAFGSNSTAGFGGSAFGSANANPFGSPTFAAGTNSSGDNTSAFGSGKVFGSPTGQSSGFAQAASATSGFAGATSGSSNYNSFNTGQSTSSFSGQAFSGFR